MCKTCGKCFTLKQGLQRHQFQHDNVTVSESDVQCEVCGQRFARRDRLQCHISLHHNGNDGRDRGRRKKKQQQGKTVIKMTDDNQQDKGVKGSSGFSWLKAQNEVGIEGRKELFGMEEKKMNKKPPTDVDSSSVDLVFTANFQACNELGSTQPLPPVSQFDEVINAPQHNNVIMSHQFDKLIIPEQRTTVPATAKNWISSQKLLQNNPKDVLQSGSKWLADMSFLTDSGKMVITDNVLQADNSRVDKAKLLPFELTQDSQETVVKYENSCVIDNANNSGTGTTVVANNLAIVANSMIEHHVTDITLDCANSIAIDSTNNIPSETNVENSLSCAMPMTTFQVSSSDSIPVFMQTANIVPSTTSIESRVVSSSPLYVLQENIIIQTDPRQEMVVPADPLTGHVVQDVTKAYADQEQHTLFVKGDVTDDVVHVTTDNTDIVVSDDNVLISEKSFTRV